MEDQGYVSDGVAGVTVGKITESNLKKYLITDGKRYLSDTEVSGFRARMRKNGIYFYFGYRIGDRKLECALGKYGTITAEQAKKAAKELAGDVVRGIDPQAIKMANKCEQRKQKQSVLIVFLESGYRNTTSEENADRVTGRIKKHFPQFLNKPMSDVTAWQIETWKKKYTGTLATGNRILAALRAVFSAAVKASILEKSPMPDIKDFREDKNKPIRSLSLDEMNKLLSALDIRQERMRAERERTIKHRMMRGIIPPQPYTGPFVDYLKPIVLTALLTGMRRGEIFNLKVTDLHFTNAQEGWIVIRGSGAKSGQTRKVPLNEELSGVLTGWLRQTGNKDLVFPSPRTGERLDNIKKAWEGLCKAAELSCRFHDLRHTFGTNLAHSGTSPVTIKAIMGHKSLSTTENYLHTNDEMMMKAVDRLSNL